MSRPPGGDHRSPLDPATLREFILGSADFTQVRRGRIGWEGEAGTEHLTVTAGQDVAVHVTTADGMALTCRLFAPAGLWALPPIGDECLVLAQEGDWTAIGAPVCLWRHRSPPSNATPTRAVLEVPADGLLVGNGATANAARVGDSVTIGSLRFVAGPPAQLFYTPPGGPEAPVTVGTALQATIAANAAKTKIE